MLYLHCGWFKTGTTSLRTALARHRGRLREAGIVYAPAWRTLTKTLSARNPEPAIEEFRSFLDAQGDRDVLCSNEWLTSLLWTGERREALAGLLAAAEEVMPVRCIWTLRRFDDLAVSFYLWSLLKFDPPIPVDRFGEFPRVEETITGLKELEGIGAGAFVYRRYDASGRHNAELLRMFELPAELCAALEGELAVAPWHNTGLTHKQTVALLNPEAVSARSGAALDKVTLQALFADGEFQFDNDGPCDLVGAGERREVHRRALHAARESGFEPYVRFFGDEAIPREPESVDLTAELLDAEDLRRLSTQAQAIGVSGVSDAEVTT